MLWVSVVICHNVADMLAKNTNKGRMKMDNIFSTMQLATISSMIILLKHIIMIRVQQNNTTNNYESSNK